MGHMKARCVPLCRDLRLIHHGSSDVYSLRSVLEWIFFGENWLNAFLFVIGYVVGNLSSIWIRILLFELILYSAIQPRAWNPLYALPLTSLIILTNKSSKALGKYQVFVELYL